MMGDSRLKAPIEISAQTIHFFEENIQTLIQQQDHKTLTQVLDFLVNNKAPLLRIAPLLTGLLQLKREPYDFNQRITFLLNYLAKISAQDQSKRDFIRHFLFSEIESSTELHRLQEVMRWFSPNNTVNRAAIQPFFVVSHLFSFSRDISAWEKLIADVRDTFKQKRDDFKSESVQSESPRNLFN